MMRKRCGRSARWRGVRIPACRLLRALHDGLVPGARFPPVSTPGLPAPVRQVACVALPAIGRFGSCVRWRMYFLLASASFPLSVQCLLHLRAKRCQTAIPARFVVMWDLQRRGFPRFLHLSGLASGSCGFRLGSASAARGCRLFRAGAVRVGVYLGQYTRRSPLPRKRASASLDRPCHPAEHPRAGSSSDSRFPRGGARRRGRRGTGAAFGKSAIPRATSHRFPG